MEAHRLLSPVCASCGKDPVDVHHIIPVAVDAKKAADPDNLISLCPDCHVAYGHAGDRGYHRYVPNVREVLRLRKVRQI
jgi:5-methylcytosine-specific restriction endonuclease McrA